MANLSAYALLWLAALLIVLLCSIEGRAQSLEDWRRVPELQLKLEQDYRACQQPARPLPLRSRSAGLEPYGQWQKPVPLPQNFDQCMRAKGWVRG